MQLELAAIGLLLLQSLPFTLAETSDSRYRRSASSSASCGVRGYDLGTIAYSYKTGSSATTFDGCRNKCLFSGKCKSFALGQGACLLYSVDVSSNFREDAESSYVFYDQGCALPLPTSKKATSSKHRPTKSTKTRRGLSTKAGSTKTKSPSGTASPNSGSTCGQAGYDRGRPEAFYYSSKRANANFEACGGLCKKYAQCASFAVGNGECLLYDAPVKGNLNNESESPYIFYDAQCLAGVKPSTAPLPSRTSSAGSSAKPSSSRSSDLGSSSTDTFTPPTPSASSTSLESPSSEPPTLSTASSSFAETPSLSISSTSVASPVLSASTTHSTSPASSISSAPLSASEESSSTTSIGSVVSLSTSSRSISVVQSPVVNSRSSTLSSTLSHTGSASSGSTILTTSTSDSSASVSISSKGTPPTLVSTISTILSQTTEDSTSIHVSATSTLNPSLSSASSSGTGVSQTVATTTQGSSSLLSISTVNPSGISSTVAVTSSQTSSLSAQSISSSTGSLTGTVSTPTGSLVTTGSYVTTSSSSVSSPSLSTSASGRTGTSSVLSTSGTVSSLTIASFSTKSSLSSVLGSSSSLSDVLSTTSSSRSNTDSSVVTATSTKTFLTSTLSSASSTPSVSTPAICGITGLPQASFGSGRLYLYLQSTDLDGCVAACDRVSCGVIFLDQGYCRFLGSTKVADLMVDTSYQDYTFYDRGCFPPSSSVPSATVPPVPSPSASLTCGAGLADFDPTMGIVQEILFGSSFVIEDCIQLCVAFSCRSYMFLGSTACITFSRPASEVITVPDPNKQSVIYDYGCTAQYATSPTCGDAGETRVDKSQARYFTIDYINGDIGPCIDACHRLSCTSFVAEFSRCLVYETYTVADLKFDLTGAAVEKAYDSSCFTASTPSSVAPSATVAPTPSSSVNPICGYPVGSHIINSYIGAYNAPHITAQDCEAVCRDFNCGSFIIGPTGPSPIVGCELFGDVAADVVVTPEPSGSQYIYDRTCFDSNGNLVYSYSYTFPSPTSSSVESTSTESSSTISIPFVVTASETSTITASASLETSSTLSSALFSSATVTPLPFIP